METSRVGELLDEGSLNRRMAESLPESTRAKEKWAVNLFRVWKETRVQLQAQGEQSGLMVINPLEELSKLELNHLLKFFIFEIRKVNGEKYPPGSLKDVVAMIQHYYVFTVKLPMSIWTDAEFADTRRALDAAMRETAKEGNMNGGRIAAPISAQDEASLWERGLLGDRTPKMLLFTMIFMIGKVFGLRGGSELHMLEYNKQIQLSTEGVEEVLVFSETAVSKTRPCGVKTFNRPIKRNTVYHTTNHERCLVCLYKRYVGLHPVNCTKPQLFLSWFRNAASVSAGKWYQNQVLGRHTLDSVVRTLMDGLPSPIVGSYTNQSLRKTCATKLRDVGMSRPDIARITGHSSGALERYIGPSAKIARVASDALQDTNGPSTSGPISAESDKLSVRLNAASHGVKSIIIDSGRVEIKFD